MGRRMNDSDRELMKEIRDLLWHISDRIHSRPADQELDKINELLRENGFEYPTGARGVEDALGMLARSREEYE